MAPKISVFSGALASPWCGCSNPPGGECQVNADVSVGQGGSFDHYISVLNEGTVDLTSIKIEVWRDATLITTLFPGGLAPGSSMTLNPVVIPVPSDAVVGWHNTTVHAMCAQLGGSTVCKVNFQVTGVAPQIPQLNACLEAKTVAICTGQLGHLAASPNEVISFTATIINHGAGTANNARLMAHGSILWTGVLPAGQSVSRSYTVTAASNFNEVASASADNAATESVQMNVTVQGQAHLVLNVMAGGVNCPADTTALQNNPFDVWYSVTNDGNGQASNVVAALYWGGVKVDEHVVGSLAAGASTAVFPKTITPATVERILLTVTAHGTGLSEQCTIGVTVLAPPVANTTLEICLSAKGISQCNGSGKPIPEVHAKQNEVVTFTASIKNTGTTNANNAKLSDDTVTAIFTGTLTPGQIVTKQFVRTITMTGNMAIVGHADNADQQSAWLGITMDAAPPPPPPPPVKARLELCLAGQSQQACAGQMLQITLNPNESANITVQVTARDADAMNVHFEAKRTDTGAILGQQTWPTVTKDQSVQYTFTITAPASTAAFAVSFGAFYKDYQEEDNYWLSSVGGSYGHNGK